MGLITGIIVAADVAAVAYVEKGLIAGHRATVGHPAVPPAAPRELIVVGLVFALPTLIVLLVAWLRSRGPSVPAAPAPRPSSPFGRGL